MVAGLYGYVSATKWLSEIRLTTLEDFDGYWIPRGWSKEAPIKTESRIDVPRSGALLPAGHHPHRRRGLGAGPGGASPRSRCRSTTAPWRRGHARRRCCRTTPGASGWCTGTPPPGTHTLRVRATDGTGETQTEDQAPPEPDGATGWHTRRVKVTG